jgi:prophage antirepressor-like protein
MNELQIFNSSEFGEIRTITIDNEPWFVGKDVAEALEYNEPHKAISRHVDEDDRMKHPVNDSTGRNQEVWIINESGVYALTFGSKLESAKRFKHWVTSEVLPSIRKTGRYGVPKTPSEQIQLIAQGYVELEHTVNGIKDDVADLKDNMPLYGCEIDEVSNHVKRRVVNVLGGKDSEAYKDSSVRGQVFSDIYTQIKREYGLVSSYKSIKRKYLADVHDFIDCYELPRYLEEQINECNAQMRIGGM